MSDEFSEFDENEDDIFEGTSTEEDSEDEFDGSEFDDELEDSEFDDEDDDMFEEDDESSDNNVVAIPDLMGEHDIVSVDMSYPLTMEEAQELTEKIRSTANVLWVLIARAHAGRAWEALGYPTFAAYVKEEFDISRSRAYQLLDQSKVIQAIESATPDGTDLNISEAAARDLKSIIDDIVPEIEDRTADASPGEAAGIVDDIIREYRDKVKEGKNPAASDDDDDYDDLDDLSDLDMGVSSMGLQGGRSNGENVDYSGYSLDDLDDFDDLDDLDDDLMDTDDVDSAEKRRIVQAAYDLYASLSSLSVMPDVMNVINVIPEQRRVQINDGLDEAVSWLTSFRDQWNNQPWAQESDDEDEELSDEFDDEFEDDDENFEDDEFSE